MERYGIPLATTEAVITEKTINYKNLFPENTWPKQVGNRYLPSSKILSYEDIYEQVADEDEPPENIWITPKLYLPFPYDLVSVRVSGRSKHYPCWWDSEQRKWVGLRLNSGDVILLWQRITQAHDVIDYRMERINKEEKVKQKFAKFKK